jgi:signal transduction histidine kinase
MAGRCYGCRSPPSRYFVGLGIYSGYVLRDPAFELNCFLTRRVYLVVVALMRGYLSTYEGEVRIALAAQAERTATMEDRLRLARDLHDGLLPSLTGTALPGKPRAARSRRIPKPWVEA